MKKKRLLFLPWLLMAALCMPLAGCGSDDNDDSPLTPVNPNTPKPERDKVYKTFTFYYFKKEGRYLVGNFNNYPSCWVIWNKGGASFQVYLVQDGKIFNAGRSHSNDTILTDEECISKALTFDVELPTNINREGLIDMIALNNTESSIGDGKIVCKADLRRGGSFSLWDNSGYKVGAGKAIPSSYSLTTVETMSIENNTSDTITVKHKGFDAKEKWYYSKANVNIAANMSVDARGVSVGEEQVSDAIKVAPGESGSIWSFYVPTGKKMTEASLVLEVNGKEVRTAPVSSGIEILLGEFYRMSVIWDGKNLDWKGVSTQKQPDYSSIPNDGVDLGLPSGTLWASWNVGATAPEDVGGYYAWGETEVKSEYKIENYTHCDITQQGELYTVKYHDIGDDIRGTEYDVAHVKWGGSWRMPSAEEWKEIIEHCNFQRNSQNGINGICVVSKINGNSIFLPASGYIDYQKNRDENDVYCRLSNLITLENNKSYTQWIFNGVISYGNSIGRELGLPVRAVINYQTAYPSDGN